jgi:transglutaminase superfamily protein
MRALIWLALVELVRHDLFLLRHDFSALHSKVHLLPVSSHRPRPEDAERICQAVAYACIWYLKPVLCLQRSAVAVTLLRQYGIPAEMVIGAQRLPLKAHAWVEIEGRVVNDKPEVQTDYLVMERC